MAPVDREAITEATSPNVVLIRRRRVIRVGVTALLFIFISLILLDHVGAFGYRGNDWSRFHQRTVRVVRAVSADQFAIEDGTVVQMIGVTPAEGNWAEHGHKYLAGRLEGKLVTLRLEPPQTRDEQKRLLAYVYLNDVDLINLDIVHDGQAFADRRVVYSLHQQIEQAENDARKKQRGMWKQITDDDQPVWRKEWLKSLRRKK